MKEKNINNLKDLRDMLAEELNKLRNGETTPAAINALSNASGKMISTVKVQLEYCKMRGETPNIPFVGDSK